MVTIAPIKGYDGYFVTSDGNIIGKRKKTALKPQETHDGYLRISLVKNGKSKNFVIHRLVAEAFIPNPNNYPCVNHKDENKHNNAVDNLEWCSNEYNNAYGTKRKRQAKTQTNREDCSKEVIQFTLDGQYIAEYQSTKEAYRQTGIDRAHISACCNHYRNQYTASGYRWAWKSEVLKNGSYDMSCLYG